MPADARVRVIVNVGLAALLGWLYGGDLYDVTMAKSSEVAALPALPSVPFAIGALVGAALGLGLTVMGVLGKRDRTWRGYRVLPIITLVVLFVDILVLSPEKAQFPSNALAAAALEGLGRRANDSASTHAVPDVRGIEALVPQLAPPPWLSKGEPIAAWTVKGFTGCTGPRVDASGEVAGTMLYCVDAEAKHGWLTEVGLAHEKRFGPPQLVTHRGTALVFEVVPQPTDDATAPGVTPTRADPEDLPFAVEIDAGSAP